MSQTKISIGHVPVNRGAWSSNTRYYKDNIVQYLGGSYIANPPGYSVDNPDAYISSKPYESVPSQLNTGWSIFADGMQNNSVHVNDAQQLSDEQKAQALANVGISGVDSEPVAGSDNLVKSGGVLQATYNSLDSVCEHPIKYTIGENNKYIDIDGTIKSYSGYVITNAISVGKGDIITSLSSGYQIATICRLEGQSYVPLTIETGPNKKSIYEAVSDMTIVCCGASNLVVGIIKSYSLEKNKSDRKDTDLLGFKSVRKLRKGSVGNPSSNDGVADTYMIDTRSIGQEVRIITSRPVTPGYMYTYNYSGFSEFVFGEYSQSTVNRIFNIQETTSNIIALNNICKGLSVGIFEKNIETGNYNVLSVDDFDGYFLGIEGGFAKDIEDSIDEINESIQQIETGTEQNYTGGIYLDMHGDEIPDEEWGVTDYIPYTQGNSVEWKFSDSLSGAKCIHFYDSSKNRIQNGYWGGNTSGVLVISASDIARYAANAAYIKASFKLSVDCYVKIGNNIVWTKEEAILGLQLLDHRLDVLEQEIGDNSIIKVNSFKQVAIDGIAAKVGQQIPKIKSNYLCLIHISDIHGDDIRMKRMIEFANAQNNIGAILATGDFSQSEWTNNGFEKTYSELYASANVPMLPVIGNHDVGLRKKIYTTNPNTNEAVGARFITPFMESNGCVQGGTNAGYYYKDFSGYNIRLIVLNEYEMPRVPNAGNTELKYDIWQRYLSQTQVNWLISTLNSVPNNYSVIVAMHQLIDVFVKYDNEFKGTVPYSNADVDSSQGKILQDIIDAYIGKTTLSSTYVVPDAVEEEVPSVTVNADFSNAKGEFICYINGHTHNDGTGQSSLSQNKQVDINVTTGSSSTATQAVYDDLYRQADGASQDAFNMIAFDTIRKEIRMLRIGANVNVVMERRDYACISYAQ